MREEERSDVEATVVRLGVEDEAGPLISLIKDKGEKTSEDTPV